MPTYQYRCPKCGDYDVNQRITESALRECKTCGGSVERLISASNFILKGSGWYTSDYSKKAAPSENKETTPETKTEKAAGHSCGGGCDHGPN